MTFNKNRELLTQLVKQRFDREIKFYSLPKTSDMKALIDDEFGFSLLQNKGQRKYFKAEDLVIPIFRKEILDGAAIIDDGTDLSNENVDKLVELVELLTTELMGMADDANLLKQTQSRLDHQKRIDGIFVATNSQQDIIH
ncbi:MAG: hypothetical protein AB8E15_04055 [Bdellovibrionales bacterium]